jgi:hypothetical protein
MPSITLQEIKFKEDRAIRARQLLNDDLLNEALAEMKREALADFLQTHRWWWSDRKRRLAAERLREIESFKSHLERIMRYKVPRALPMA